MLKNFKKIILIHPRYTLIGLLYFLAMTVFAQNEYQLSGTVNSSSGQPISNVSVSIEGTSIDPVISDSLGYFSINVPDGNVWILINPVDTYEPRRIFLNGRSELITYLTPRDSRSGYDEVIVSSGRDLRRNIKGAAFAEKNLNKNYPYLTIGQDFQGKIPGMLVVNNSGMPGSGTYSVIRGISGLFTNQQPRYIIDGIIYENPGNFQSTIDGFNMNPLSGIDPNDVVSVTVLKDASHTALYGTKAGKGIILVETLKPTETLTKIDISAFSGISSQPDHLPVLKSGNYRTLAQDLLQTSGQPDEFFKEQYPGLFDDSGSPSYFRYNNETSWQEEIFRNAVLNGLYASVRGGDEIGKYGLSVGLSNAQGIIKATGYNRFSIRFVGSMDIFEWLRMSVSTNLNYTRSDILETGIDPATSPIFSSLFKAPFMSPYQYSQTGEQLLYLDNVDVLGTSNPTAIVNKVDALNNAYRFIGSFRFQGDLTQKLKWNTVVGLNFNTMKENIFLPERGMTRYMEGEANNLTRHKADYFYSLQLDNNFGYETNLSGVQKITTFLGMRVITNQLESDIGISANTPSDEYKSLRYGASGMRMSSGDIGNWNWLSYYGNAEYSLLDRYYFGANFSVDGSSRVGKDADLPIRLFNRPFGFFPSVSAAWRISDEAPLKNLSWLGELKARVSYGLSGNDDIGNYNSRPYYRQVLYRETTGLVIGSLPNTGLMHETYQMLNAGIDFSLFGDRAAFTADYYNTVTTDMFILNKLSDYLGYEFFPTNKGRVRNNGLEFSVSSRIIERNKFKWDTHLNIAFNTNTVLSTNGNVATSEFDLSGNTIITDIPGGQIITMEGKPVNSFYGYIAERVYASTQEALEDNLVNEYGNPFVAGDIKFRDISGPDGVPDGIIDEFDKTFIGSPNPDFFGGAATSLYLGKWSLDVFLQFVYGNEVFNYLRSQNEKMSDLNNQSTSVLRRWQYEGHETDIPRAYWNDIPGNARFSDRWIEDGSYIRLKSLTLAYTIPDKFLTFQNARFYCSANNVFTLTRYLGYDPEFSFSPNSYLQGADYGNYPAIRSYVIGVKLGL